MATAADIRVLVIDDDDDVRRSICRGLRTRGFSVVDLPSGKGAEDVAQGQQVDLVLTDLVMPGREGCETILGLRARHPALPIVILTASAQYAGMGLRLGARAALIKPSSLDQLEATILSQVGAPAPACDTSISA